MDSSAITALAALMGATIGGLTSFLASWFSQRTQARAQLVAQDTIQRQELYKEFIEEAVQLTGKVAAAVGASVTLLHVMAEPPAIYADLVRLEEDVDRLLGSRSELGLNLRRQKEELEHLGVPAEVHVRHGIVIDEVMSTMVLTVASGMLSSSAPCGQLGAPVRSRM